MDHDQENYLNLRDLECEHVEKLANYFVDGELRESLRNRFEKHVESCSRCGELVTDLQDLVSLAKSLQKERIPRDVSLRLREALKKRVGHDVSMHSNVVRLSRDDTSSTVEE